MNDNTWIGFDLDKTIAHYDTWQGLGHVGRPISEMVRKIKAILAAGYEVRIFTARVSGALNKQERRDVERVIRSWCRQHIGQELPVTSEKDFDMWCLYDDRAVSVEPNTGKILGGEPPELAVL